MLVLALDTSTERASVVLADDDRELAAWREATHRDLCRRLAPHIQRLLASAGRAFDDLKLLAVGLGPGTFTGMRVGLATAKAIALARALPLVGVSSLQAMAWQVRHNLPGLVCPVLDARREEVYAAVYHTAPDAVEPVETAFVARPERLAERLPASEEQVTLFGQVDRIPADRIERAITGPASVWREKVILPDALAVAQLGRRRYAARGGDDIASLRPIYVRMSYAEERFDIDLGLR